MMSQSISSSCKRPKVSCIRDFPLGCNTHSTVKTEVGSDDDVAIKSETKENLNSYQDSECDAHHNNHRRKEESFDSIMKKAGFDIAPNGKDIVDGKFKFPPLKRKFTSLFKSKVKPLSSEEGIQLMASECKRRRCFGNIQMKPLKAVQKHRSSPANKKLSNAAALRLRANAHKPTQHRDERRSNQLGVISVIQQNRITKNLSPRQKVLKALRVFKHEFKRLDRDKAAMTRTDYETRAVLIERGMQVNRQKMIGPVPGIQVGDGFQFKAELNIIGLHFSMRGGIDYMKKGNMELATSIVSAEGNGYIDRCDSDVLVYCGQGGNKDTKIFEDQKLVGGNMALVNSMRRMTPVRVILGKKGLNQRGKNYVYVGLYMVEDYWREKGPHGCIVFMFKLSRVAGQPYVEF